MTTLLECLEGQKGFRRGRQLWLLIGTGYHQTFIDVPYIQFVYYITIIQLSVLHHKVIIIVNYCILYVHIRKECVKVYK